MNLSENQEPTQNSVTCCVAITAEEFFKEALGDIYSHRYFEQHQKMFPKMLFILDIKSRQKAWTIIRNSQEIKNLLKGKQHGSNLSQTPLQNLENIESMDADDLGKIIEDSLSDFVKAHADSLSMAFFGSEQEGFGRFLMKKTSGNRQKQSTCCKIGALFHQSKQFSLGIFQNGVGYYNQEGQIREFLSFGHGFHFQIGRPSTGLQFGITIYANHRRLSAQARNIKDFVFLLFALRKACRQSCYTSINRYNSFAPIRYESASRFLVDGEQYFGALFQSLMKATKSIYIMGWMLSPEFLLKRQGYKVSLEDVLKKADSKGVIIRIILYRQSSFLSNGSQYTKQKLEKLKNVKVLCHPSKKDAVLWSHHEKMVIIDEKQAFVGGLDICYGRYDKKSHELYPPVEQYPGIQHNNIRKNDQWDVKSPNELGISRHQCKLPWHDIAQSLRGDVVNDLAHHFYQIWNFVRFEQSVQPQQEDNCLIDNNVKTVFSTKIIPASESELSSDSGIIRAIETKLNTIKTKGRDILNSVKQRLNGDQKREEPSRLRLSAPQDYFTKYVKEIAEQIEQRKNALKSLGKKSNRNRNSGARSSRSSRYSADQIKKVRESVRADAVKEEGPKKTNSFLLTGKKVLDFVSVQIDKDYVECLQKVKSHMKPTQEVGQLREIESEGQLYEESKLTLADKGLLVCEGRDQCQVVRSVGNWSVGCHSSNTEFSIHIAYLQLISQARHFIYMENQFFISSLANPKLVKNQIAEALYLRIRKAILNQERFKVYVVLPLIPACSGDLEVEDCILLRKQMQWQYDTISRGPNSLWQRLLAHTDQPGQYIQFLGLRNHGRLKNQWQPQTQIIYINSNIMIVDDEVVLCGSANINDRSLYGDRDSQLAVVTRGEDYIEGRIDGQSTLVSQVAQELRIKLWVEHFRFTEQEAFDPTAEATFQSIAQRAAQNTALYRKIFGCYPDDQMTSRRSIEQKKRQSNIELYDELSPRIVGHIVEFPLRFLEDDSLTELRTEKEFSVPTQCLT